MAKIKMEQPTLLIGSPTCTAFSAWQYISNTKRDAKVVAKEKARGRRHLSFCCEVYQYQVSKGRYFVHEHPAQATSWCTEAVKRILGLEGVDRSWRKGQRSRSGGGEHALCNGHVAGMAAIFPLKLCLAILGGLWNQFRKDGVFLNGHIGMQECNGDAKMCLAHADGCGYNLDGSVNLCASEDIVRFDVARS